MIETVTAEIVLPAIARVFSPGEVQSLTVHNDGDQVAPFRLDLVALGENFSSGGIGCPRDAAGIEHEVNDLASQLADFVSETPEAWGQARYDNRTKDS